jgi:predicted enzyme related to lactoylglutathione lyase
MADKTSRGRFVWHELMTSDSVAAYGFYTKTLGWKTVTHEGDAGHTSFAAPSGPLGNASHLDGGASRWIAYIGTTDLEQTISDATDKGATVAKSITSVPGGGRYVHLTDPQGATFGVYASDARPPREAPPKRGEYSWHELATTDGDAAFEFYASLFGWEKMVEHDMGDMGMYLIFGHNGKQLGGIYKKMPDQPGPAWLGYVRVKDVEKTVKKVKSAGGQLINGPMDVPGGDRIAQFLDPQGAMFAVHTLLADLQPATAKQAAAPAEPTAAAEEDDDSESSTEPEAKAPARKAAVKKAAPKRPPAKKAVVEDESDEDEDAEDEKPAAKKVAAKSAAKKKAPTKVAAKAKAPARKTAKAAKKKTAKKSVKKAAKPPAKKKAGKKVAKRAAKKGAKKSRKAK